MERAPLQILIVAFHSNQDAIHTSITTMLSNLTPEPHLQFASIETINISRIFNPDPHEDTRYHIIICCLNTEQLHATTWLTQHQRYVHNYHSFYRLITILTDTTTLPLEIALHANKWHINEILTTNELSKLTPMVQEIGWQAQQREAYLLFKQKNLLQSASTAYTTTANYLNDHDLPSGDQYGIFSHTDEILKNISNEVLELLKQLVGWDKATIMLVWDDRTRNNTDQSPCKLRSLIAYRGYSEAEINYELHKPIEEDQLMQEVIKYGQPYVIEHVDSDYPHWEKHKQTEDIKSWLALPLIAHTTLVGIITLDHRTPYHYQGVNQQLLYHIAEHTAEAIQIHFRNRNDTIVKTVMQRISTTYDYNDTIQAILDVVRRSLRCARCTYFQRREVYEDRENKVFAEFIVDERGPQPNDEKRYRLQEGQGVAGTVLKTGESLNIPDTKQAKEEFDKRSNMYNNPRSMLAVPINLQEKMLGKHSEHQSTRRTVAVLCVDSDHKHFFTNYDLDVLETIARQVSTVIERTTSINFLHKTINEITQNNNIDKILQMIIENALLLTNATSGVIYILENDLFTHDIFKDQNEQKKDFNSYWRLSKVISYPESFVHQSPRLSDNEKTISQSGLIYDILSSSSVNPKQYSRIHKNIYLLQKELVDKQQVTCVIGIQIKLENKYKTGVLFLNSATKNLFNELEVFSLRVFANYAAFVIDNTDKVHQLDIQKKALENLTAATRAIARNHKPVATFEDIAKQACTLVDAEYSHVAIINSDGRTLDFQASYPIDVLGRLREEVLIDLEGPKKNLGICGLAINRRKTVLVSNVDEQVRKALDSDIKEAYINFQPTTMSELSVPIFSSETYKAHKVIGVINIEHREPYKFTEYEQRIVELFAAQASLAIYKQTIINISERRSKHFSFIPHIIRLMLDVTSNNIEYTVKRTLRRIQSIIHTQDIVFIEFANREIGEADLVKCYSTYGQDTKVFIRESKSSLSRRVYIEGREIKLNLHDDIDRRKANEAMINSGIEQAFCIPLNAPEAVIGAIWFNFEHFDPERIHDVDIFTAYADTLASMYVKIKYPKGYLYNPKTQAAASAFKQDSD